MARAELVHALVNDALRVLDACADVEDLEGAPATRLLALVAGQDVELDDDGRWRIVRGVAKDRVISVVDPESRHMHKSRSEYRDGYKAHLCVEPETGLITAAALTPASTPDGPTGVALLEGEEPGLQVLADGAYGSGDTLAALGRRTSTRDQAPPEPSRLRADCTVTTSSSTRTPPPPPVRPVTSSRSPRAQRHVRRALRELPAALSMHDRAPRKPLPSHFTTPSSSSLDAPGATATSFWTIESIDRWSKDRLRGS